MSHVCRSNGGDHIGNAWAVLTGDNAASSRYPGVGIFHMTSALLMANGNEFDPSRGKQIKHIHKSGSDNAANMIHAFSQKGFDNCLAGRHFYFFHFKTSVSFNY
jgi:hypothetical protein